MKNIKKGINLFLCFALCLFSAFFCFNITIYGKSEECNFDEQIENYEQTNNLNVLGLNDVFSYKSWGAEKMGVPEYSQYLLDIVEADNGYDELEEIVVAVLDTGIDTDHPWFTNRFLYDKNGKILGMDYTADDTNVNATEEYAFEDDQGHGTHCAGIICDMTLPNVKILPIKILYADEEGDGTGNMLDALDAIEYVISLKQNEKINIVAMNMSFGGTLDPNKDGYDDLVQDFTSAIEDAYDAGIFSVVAAGNDEIDAHHDLPAMIDRAITVAAIDEMLEVAYFSNYGECIDVCAPGVSIESAYFDGNTKYDKGTSMAAPHITSYIALLKSNPCIDYTMSNIEEILSSDFNNIETVKDLGNTGKDTIYGYGLPILDNLVEYVAYTVNFLLEPIYDLKANVVPDFATYQMYESQTLYGVLNDLTNAVAEKITGFTALEFSQQTIEANTTINIYYKRNKYTLTIQASETGIAQVLGSGEYLFGESVGLIPVLENEYIWDKWQIIQCSNNAFMVNFVKSKAQQVFLMPACDIVLKAVAKMPVPENLDKQQEIDSSKNDVNQNIDWKNLDWSNLLVWGCGFVAVIVILMLISRPRIKR